MKGIFLTLAIFSIGSLLAQDAPNLIFPTGVEIQNATPQQLADAVSQAVKENPQKATMLVRQAMRSINNAEGKFSDIDKKRAASIVSAALAAAPSLNSNAIIAAGAGAAPALGAIVLQAANAVPTGKNSPAQPHSSSGMLLGNIRVQEVTGKGVKLIDSEGKISNLKGGEFLSEGARVVTGPEGSAVLIFENGSLIRVSPETEFSIEKFQQDPFASDNLDYSTIKNEPTRSVTRTGVIKGEISFDVATLKKNSTFEIMTPVGVAGIRGTGGFVKSSPNNLIQAASFGLFEGAASFTSSSGQTQVVNQNQAIGISGARGNFAINPNPPGSNASLLKASQGISQARSQTVSKPFIGAPPSKAAPSGPISNLSPAQQIALQQAAADGAAAVEQTALQLAMERPQAVADIATAAADLEPAIAATLAVRLAITFPNEAATIASAVSSSASVMSPSIASLIAFKIPNQATSVASAVAVVAPTQAVQIAIFITVAVSAQTPAIAAAVATSIPNQASMVAATLASIAPAQASSIAAAVAITQPTQAASIAASVAFTVPNQSTEIATAVSNAVPAQTVAVVASVESSSSSQAKSTGAGEAALPLSQTLAEFTDQANTGEQNPEVLVTGSPTPISTPNPPSSTPPPKPPTSTPEPTIPPVSPSA